MDTPKRVNNFFLIRRFDYLVFSCLFMIHLLLQSLVPHSEHNHGDEKAKDGDKQALYRAFIVFLGVYLFFLVECIMKLKLARRKKSDKHVRTYFKVD